MTAPRAYRRLVVLGAAVLALVAAPASPAAAQAAGGVPNALQGFSANRNQPIHIKAATLEVRDKEKKATFSGNVHVVQGDTTLKCKVLDVFYDQDTTPGGLKAAEPGPSGQQQIRRLEAKGGVVVIQKDQTATGDTGIYDMKSNTVTLLGSVVVTQGPNVVRGDRLIVDLATGLSRVESGKPGQSRVEGLFLPNSTKDMKKPAGGKDAAKSAPRSLHQPMKLN